MFETFLTSSTVTKLDAGGLPDALHVPNEPETRTRRDDKLILKIGGAIANDIDTYFSILSSGKIKGQRNKGKLIDDFAEAMLNDGKNLHSNCYQMVGRLLRQGKF
jgi:hypothetical protein